MQRSILSILAASALFAATAPAQIVTFGGNGERKSSSIFFYDRAANKLAGGLEFTYGAPAWKDDYDAMVNSKKSGAMRLGKDGWATLDNSTPLTIGGTKIPAGSWYLGLGRADGKFHLMVMDAKTLRAKKIPSWETGKLKAKIQAPLTHSKVEAKAEALTITAAPGKGKSIAQGTFTLHWGNHKLSAPLVAHLNNKSKSKPTSKKSGS